MFSIVVTSRDSGPRVGKALRSVQSQLYPAWQVILVEHGAEGTSRPHARPYERSFGPNLQSHWLPGASRAAAVAEGVARANGQFLLVLRAEDELLPLTLQHFSCRFRSAPRASACFGRAILRADADELRPSEERAPMRGDVVASTLERRLAIESAALAWRRCDLPAADGLGERWPGLEHIELLLRLEKDRTLAAITEDLAIVSADGSAATADGSWRRFTRMHADRIRQRIGSAGLDAVRAAGERDLARACWRAGQQRRAFAHFDRASRLAPNAPHSAWLFRYLQARLWFRRPARLRVAG